MFCGLNIFSKQHTTNIRTPGIIDLYSTTYNLQDKFPFRSDVTEKTFQSTVSTEMFTSYIEGKRMISLTLRNDVLFLLKTFTHFLNYFKWFQKILVRFEKFLQHRCIKTGGRTQIFSFEMLQPCNENQFKLHLPMAILKAGYSNCKPRQTIGDSYKALFIMALRNSSLIVLCILS